MLIGNIISIIEDFAPAALQESWDNTGVQTGSLREECTGVMLCVDCTEDVIAEAKDRGCNLVVSHHPLLFRGLKRLTGSSPVERTLIAAVRAGITIYSAHTSLDSATGGVSWRMARMLGATPLKPLKPLTDKLLHLSVTLPSAQASDLAALLTDFAWQAPTIVEAQAVEMLDGDGADFGSVPSFGTSAMAIVSALVPTWQRSAAEKALMSMARNLTWQFLTVDTPTDWGLGVVATFQPAITADELTERVKQAFDTPVVRASAGALHPDEKITRIALCGGAGGEFLGDALRAGAQAYVNSDTRYHDFVDFGRDILILDIGHFDSEKCTKQIIYDKICEKLPNFAVYKSQSEQNPIRFI